MADPITAVGLAASVIQIAGAGVQLSTALYQYTTSAVHADQDITDISSDVKLTSNALESVGKVFSTQDAKCMVSQKAIQDASEIIKRCEIVFDDISKLVNKGTRLKNGQKRLSVLGKWSWPMKDKRVELHKKRLESLKNSLMLLLHVLQLAQGQARGQVAEESLQMERENIRQLHQRQQDSLKSLYELERKFEEFAHAGTSSTQDENVTSRGVTLELTSPPSSQEELPIKQMGDEPPVNILSTNFTMLDATKFNRNESATDEKNEHVSLEELDKAAKHVQQLLDHITQLQKSFDVTNKSRSHRKEHVDEIYRQFCRKWEEDIAVLPNNPDERVSSSSSSVPEVYREPSDSPTDLSALLQLDASHSHDTIPRYCVDMSSHIADVDTVQDFPREHLLSLSVPSFKSNEFALRQSESGPESPVQPSVSNTQKMRAAVLRWRLRAKTVVGLTQTESAETPKTKTQLANDIPGVEPEEANQSSESRVCLSLSTSTERIPVLPAPAERRPTLPAQKPDLPTWGRPRVRQWFTAAANHLGNAAHQKLDVSDYQDSKARAFPEIPGERLRNADLGRISPTSKQYNLLRVERNSGAEKDDVTGARMPKRNNILEVPTPIEIHRRQGGHNSTLTSFELPRPYSRASRRLNRRDTFEVPNAIYIHKRSSIQNTEDESHQRDIVDILLEQWTTTEPQAGKLH